MTETTLKSSTASNTAFLLENRRKMHQYTRSEPTRKEFKRLRKANERVVRWAHENRIALVVLKGKSAKSAAEMFKVKWKELYKKEKMPQFYALGFSASTVALGPETIKERVKGIQSLMKGLDKPMLLYTEYSREGQKTSWIIKAFEELGAKQIFTGALYAKYEKPENPLFLKTGLSIIGKGGMEREPFFSDRRAEILETGKDRRNILAKERALKKKLRKIARSPLHKRFARKLGLIRG